MSATKIWILLISAFLLPWLFYAICIWNFNPGTWTAGARFFMLVLDIFTVGFALIIIADARPPAPISKPEKRVE